MPRRGEQPMTEQELRDFLDRVETAMHTEGRTGEQVQRVGNWLIYGNPLGAEANVSLDEMKAKVRRDVLEAYNLPESLTGAWAANREESCPMSDDIALRWSIPATGTPVQSTSSVPRELWES